MIMNKEQAINIIWDYMLLNHTLEKSDMIFVLGNSDLRVAHYAADLFLEGWAPYILFSGSGSIHNHKSEREVFRGTTEAEVFADIAREKGVPEESIIIEDKSQNTGQNYEFAIMRLEKKGVYPKKVIAVQKPYMERRTYATGKVWWPDIELIVTSPPILLEDYQDGIHRKDDSWISSMVGNLQRIKEYPKRGFQIPQDIPDEVWEAYEYLVSIGYDKKLIKD